MKSILICKRTLYMVAIVLCAVGYSESALSGSRSEEQNYIRYVMEHPEIDYVEYRVMTNSPTSGIEIVTYAASRNYEKLLSLLEEKGRAISRFEVDQNEFSPLHVAMACDAEEVLCYLLKIRPEWINQSPEGMASPVMTALNTGKTNILELLLDAGADINTRGHDGRTLLDCAASSSMGIYEQIRKRGGKSGVAPLEFRWDPSVWSGLISQYQENAIHIFQDRILFPSGLMMPLPILETDSIGAAKDVVKRVMDDPKLKQELEQIGQNTRGTLIVRVDPNSDNLNYLYLEPTLAQLNLAALYLPEKSSDWGTLRQWYVPNISGSNGALYQTSEE